MTLVKMLEEYRKSIKVYEEHIAAMRTKTRPTADDNKKLYIMEEALVDMRYAVGVMTRDIKEERIVPHRWDF